jgi:hypothetical protein
VEKAALGHIFSSNFAIAIQCSAVICISSAPAIIQPEKLRESLNSISLSYVYETPQRDRSLETATRTINYVRHKLTAWCGVFLERLPAPQLVNNFPAFYGIQTFIAVLTKPRLLSLSGTRRLQSTPSQPISLQSVLTLSSHLHLGLPRDTFPSYHLTKIMYAFVSSPRCSTRPTYLFLLKYLESCTNHVAPYSLARNKRPHKTNDIKVQDADTIRAAGGIVH